MIESDRRLGATYLGHGRCQFLVWAPFATTVDLHLVSPEDRLVRLAPGPRGYHHGSVERVAPGARYLYRLNGNDERPDPASRSQPDGVHRASQVVGREFPWQDQSWFGLPLSRFVIYELHVGTFTTEGTFGAIVGHLADLRALGVTAIELMPVAQFPGGRNWGYDGVYPFAAQSSYGGPIGLKRLVDAAHAHGLAVVLDVVYNHLGPEGNYLGNFGPYFTDRYRTPWGLAVNVDGPGSDEVRRYFVENALGWLDEFHVDALRLDAVEAIRDASAIPFLEELAIEVGELAQRLNRRLSLIAESDLNDTRIIRARGLGGLGLDAQWNDDFHHALHALLTGERVGYYADFGDLDHLARAWREGFVYTGDYSPHRQHRHGNSSRQTPAEQFVVCAQNHDQVGNRMLGERLSHLVSFEGLKLAASAVLLSPFVPLLFMGEEYGETAPFLYFTSHGDPELVRAVREGRRAEFAAFQWSGEMPDPQDEATFDRSKLRHGLRQAGQHRVLADFYRELLRLRATRPALASLSKETQEVISFPDRRALVFRRWHRDDQVVVAFNFGDAAAEISARIPRGDWRKALDSAEPRWLGSGTSVPERLSSDGEVTFALAPKASLVLEPAIE
ncbi:MAG: malto-oligosyltrehalose trehalohydrolase [Chloroflexota bacterium]